MRLTPSFPQPTPRTVVQTGTLATGSPVVTGLANTALLSGALFASGTGVPASACVESIDSATQVTLNANATASGSASIAFQLEPVTLAEAKQHLRIGFGDDDSFIAALVVAARMEVEAHLRQALLTQSFTLLLDSFPSAGGYFNRAIREVWPSLGGLPSGLGFYPGLIPNSTGVIDIPCPPLQSITAVQYKDFAGTIQTFPSASYNVSTGVPPRIQPAYSKVWPISQPVIDSVQIGFTAGYGDTPASVPEVIKAAIRLLLADLYEHRESNSDVPVIALPDTLVRLLATVDHGSYY